MADRLSAHSSARPHPEIAIAETHVFYEPQALTSFKSLRLSLSVFLIPFSSLAVPGLQVPNLAALFLSQNEYLARLFQGFTAGMAGPPLNLTVVPVRTPTLLLSLFCHACNAGFGFGFGFGFEFVHHRLSLKATLPYRAFALIVNGVNLRVWPAGPLPL